VVPQWESGKNTEKLLAVRLSSLLLLKGVSISSQLAELNGLMTAVGRALAGNDYNLVYGGGCSGLMGIVSDAALEAGGDVTGIMPFAMCCGYNDKADPAPVFMNGSAAGRGKVGHPLHSDPSLI